MYFAGERKDWDFCFDMVARYVANVFFLLESYITKEVKSYCSVALLCTFVLSQFILQVIFHNITVKRRPSRSKP